MTNSENVRETISQLAEPLRDQLDELTAEITQTQISLAELHQTRRDVVRVLSLIDPTFVTARNSKPKPTPTSKSSHTKIGPDTVNSIREFVREHRESLNEGGFSAMDLRRRVDWKFSYRQQPVVEALKRLNDEGFLRLDRTGVAGSRYYKVVADG